MLHWLLFLCGLNHWTLCCSHSFAFIDSCVHFSPSAPSVQQRSQIEELRKFGKEFRVRIKASNQHEIRAPPSNKSCFSSFNQAQAARVLPVLQPQPPHLPTARFPRPVQANHHRQKLNLLLRPDLSLLRPAPPCPKSSQPHPPWTTPTKTLPRHLQLPYQHLFQTDILQLLHSQQELQEVRTPDLKQQKGPRV